MLWVKALHVISVISWMAALLYLPRLFIYHCDAKIGSVQSGTFKVMERRLLRGIMTPAMIGAWGFGLWLVFGFGVIDFSQGWVWVKFALVIGLTGVHGFLAKTVRIFAADANVRSARFFRYLNEVPTVVMIVVVIMVIVRPF